jgi:transcriptional regulator with XRE-family HTH domain
MAFQSMISDHREVSSRTVIEAARRAAGLSQRRLAELARTQQSSISEYERRRKSPTLDVVERLLDAADHDLVAKPMVLWDEVDDPDVGSFWVPDKLWAVPAPKCFAKVQAFKYVFPADATQDWTEFLWTWDLSVTSERIDYYQFVVQHGMDRMVEDSVDGLLLIQAWPEMTLPLPVRRAWQPLIDGATKHEGPPLDPGGVSEWMAGELKLGWPLPKRWRGAVPRSE